MIPNLKTRIIFLAAMLLVFLCCLPKQGNAQYYQVRTYQEWDGMPSNSVFDAAQDSLGRMLFCTRVGLTIFNGRSWEIQPSSPYASAHPQAKLKVDSRGTLWAVSHYPPFRLSRRVAGKWTTAPFVSIALRNFTIVGMEVLNLQDGTDRVAVATFNGIVLIWNGSRWQYHEGTEEMGNILSTELIDSLLYLATSQGLFSLEMDGVSGKIQQVPDLPPGPFTHLARIAQSESLWLVGPDRLGIWDGSHFTLKKDNLVIIPPKPGTGTVALVDQVGGLYFGGQRSVHYFHPETGLEILTPRNGLVASGATAIFQDRESNIWITSTRGISKIISRRFAAYNRESGLLEDEVSSILQMKNGQIVLGHEGGLTFQSQQYRTLRFDGLPAVMGRVMDLLEDRWGNLWIAADRQGLARLSPHGLVRWFDEKSGLKGGVFALHLDNDGTLWAGTAEGLFRKNKNQFELVLLPNLGSPASPMIRRLIPGPDGSFYIVTAKVGVFWHQDGHFTQYLPNKGLTTPSSYACLPLPDGGLYVGTYEGLFKVHNGILVATSYPDPVIHRPIYSILQDDQGHFWFGTDLGVMRWDGTRLRHFTIHDGLLGNETNRDALIQTDDGNIWIGTDSGASEYRRIFDVPAAGFPHLQITGFMVDGKETPVDGELVLAHPPHTIEVLYEGFSFLDESRTYYHTQLQNFENRWHDVEAPNTGSSSLNYINIPPGEYRFLVQAIRVDGVGSEVMASPWITIKPTFINRWFVRAVLILITLGMVWALFALLSGRRYARRLENEVYQQTWELRLSEKSIKSESRRLAATLKNITDGVLAVGVDGTVVLANAAAENILGLSQTEIVGRNLDIVLPIGPHQSGETLLRFPHPYHQDRLLEVSTSEVREPDSTSENPTHGRVVAFRDITELLHQEEERIRTQKLESLGVFAGGLAHDFNNLLTVMLGNISVLEASPSIPKSDLQMLGLVREASERAQSLTRQLLTFARGSMPLLETASIGQIVRQSVDFSLSGTNVSCAMDLPDNLWPVKVDPGQIHQVLANLVINAVHAMPEGGTIKVTGRNIGSKTRRMVVVEVADEGTGISPENLSRIFDPYFTTKDLGSGLGLAIAYSIITKHGGNITVDSKLGEGSVFRVFLKAI